MKINETLRFIERLFPLNRSISSPGLDEALNRIKQEFIPELVIEGYPANSEAWTWILPRKWDLHTGFLEESGRRIIDTDNEPLCVWSGSLAVDREFSYDDLIPHLYSEPERPDLLCWYYRYFGELDWGFNLPHNLVKRLDPKARFRAKIDARYSDDEFKVGYLELPGVSRKKILITSDICHPYQCNDSLTGAAVAYGLYRYLRGKKNYYTYVFTFVPETIGTIALLSNHEDWLSDILYHLYSEFWGCPDTVYMQRSLKGDSVLDKIAEQVLLEKFPGNSRVISFWEKGVVNDELVTSMPNTFIPSLAFYRGLYFAHYHSHLDTPENLNIASIEEGLSFLKEVINRLETTRDIPQKEERGSIDIGKRMLLENKSPTDFIPAPCFKGPLFLSRYGLWVDWRTDEALNYKLSLIMACLDGKNSVAEIAAFCDLPFQKVFDFVKKLEEKKLVQRKGSLPCPGTK